MTRKIWLIFLFALLVLPFFAEPSMDYGIGILSEYSSYSAKIGQQESSLNTFKVGVKTHVSIDESKSLYFGGGYQVSGFGDELVFEELPISVETDFGKGGLFFFLGGSWDVMEFATDFYLSVNSEIAYQTSNTTWQIKEYDYLEGKVEGKLQAFSLRFAGEISYDAGEMVQPFAGVALHYFTGKVRFHQSFQDLEGEQEEGINPKLPVEIYLGTQLYFAENVEGRVKIGFLNGLSFGAGFSFVF